MSNASVPGHHHSVRLDAFIEIHGVIIVTVLLNKNSADDDCGHDCRFWDDDPFDHESPNLEERVRLKSPHLAHN